MMRPVVVLLDFPYFLGILAVFWALEPKFTIVLFDPQNGPFYAPKTIRSKERVSNFDTEHT